MQRQSKIYTAVVSFLVATRKTLEKIAQKEMKSSKIMIIILTMISLSVITR